MRNGESLRYDREMLHELLNDESIEIRGLLKSICEIGFWIEIMDQYEKSGIPICVSLCFDSKDI